MTIMTIVLLAVGSLIVFNVGFVAGCAWAGHSKRDLLELLDYQAVTIEDLKAAQNHEPCMQAMGRMWKEADQLREYANYLESKRTVGDEAADHLRREAGP